jgi:hypothetical protein
VLGWLLQDFIKLLGRVRQSGGLRVHIPEHTDNRQEQEDEGSVTPRSRPPRVASVNNVDDAT